MKRNILVMLFALVFAISFAFVGCKEDAKDVKKEDVKKEDVKAPEKKEEVKKDKKKGCCG